ncbi:hypothetical protein N9Z83_00705 [Akkermansiaceae bacterium]|nr:hypothetical protein [Akkermansiaceae bacterium]
MFSGGGPVPGDITGVPGSFKSLQPYRIPGTSERGGGFIYDIGGTSTLYQVRNSGGNATFTNLGTMNSDARLATEVLGDDGRLCIIGYEPGDGKAEIVTLPYLGFSFGTKTSNAIGFPIGTIVGVPPSVPSAPHGVLITSADRSVAVYATIKGGELFIIEETFSPDEDLEIVGMVPVPQVGLMALQGKFKGDGRIQFWNLYQENGGTWDSINSNKLSGWLPPQVNFATLFWFNGEPLVNPAADILKFETHADWTRKLTNDPIAKVELSNLGGTITGLSPSSTLVPSIPTGATHLMANQFDANVSISALDSDLALLSPSLAISPASGDYVDSVTVTALYDSAANDLFYRESTPGSVWQLFETLTVGYPSSWLFYAKNKSTGATGPIVQRAFDFPGVDLNEIDSDGDTVPDYVERELGLDPAGGTDSDGDFQSDLEEILGSTLPDDHLSNIPTASRNPPFIGEGFEFVTQAFNRSNQGASPQNDFFPTSLEDDFPGETLRGFSMVGELLAEENVVELTAPPALVGQDGAAMSVGSPIPARQWITLATPSYFNVLDLLTPPRTGRECFKVMSRPVNPIPQVVHSPTGTDRAADAQAWIVAAQAAHSGTPLVTSLTEIHPEDTMVAALAEQALYDSLRTLDGAEQAALGVPATIDEFTLFPFRDGEAAKVPFSTEMYEALLDAGCDFPALIALLEGASADPVLVAFANLIEATLVSNGPANPLMAFPLDVYRSIIRSGVIVDPAPGDPVRTNPYNAVPPLDIANAKTEFDALLAQVPNTKRPTAQWTLIIENGTTPGHRYNYRRGGNNALAWLVDDFGERVLLEQGLGLALNAVFEVTGYADVTGPAGFDVMEIIRIDSVTTPVATDNDTNGNLLDDGWEEVFFGDLGVVEPFDLHPTTGHSYLQYHIEGADPRSGNLAVPVVYLWPTNKSFVWSDGLSVYDLEFDFPAAYFDDFDFTLQSSSDLSGFSGPANVGGVTPLGGGRYRFRISGVESNLDTNFFRIGLSLKAP